jgi:hypothetical protein
MTATTFDRDTVEEIQSDMDELICTVKHAREHLDCAHSCEDGLDLLENLAALGQTLKDATAETLRLYQWAAKKQDYALQQRRMAAAAPELYAACKSALEFMTTGGLPDQVRTVVKSLEDAVKSASN